MIVEKKDIDEIIKGIVKDMDASRSIDEISVRNGVDTGFVEDVLQIY